MKILAFMLMTPIVWMLIARKIYPSNVSKKDEKAMMIGALFFSFMLTLILMGLLILLGVVR